MKVKLEDLELDPELYPRHKTYWKTVYQYKEAMRNGDVFPPLEVGKLDGELYLIDGWHRMEAYNMLDVEEVEANIIEVENRKELLKQAIIANVTHGRPLSVTDKARLMYKLHEMEESKKEISKLLHIPMDKFDTFLKRIVKVDDRIVELKPLTLDSLEKSHISEKDIKKKVAKLDQSSFQTSRVVNLLRQLISLLESDLYPVEHEKIYPKTVKLHELLEGVLGGKPKVHS